MIVEHHRTHVQPLPVPEIRSLVPVEVDRSATAGAATAGQLAAQVILGRCSYLADFLADIEIVHAPVELAERAGQIERVVEPPLQARELPEACIDITGGEVSDLRGGVTREGAAGRVVGVVGRVVAGFHEILQSQGLDGL